ncbi:MAG: DUF928 domain-containing protein [Xenococcus sp. (in: cyanobacteria)]
MKINLHLHKLSFVFVVFLELISLFAYSRLVFANSNIKSTYAELIEESSEDIIFIDFSGDGRPNEQTDAASRGSCEGIHGKELTALVPKKHQKEGSTISEYPTFWVYIPYESKNVRYAELVLQNEVEKIEIARIPYELKETPGIVSITIPPKPEYSLKTNTIDHWYFRVVCNNENRYAVGGFIKRVTVDSADYNYDSYLDNQIWYDALTDLAERLRLAPQDTNLQQEWHDLMKAKGVDLEQLAEEFTFGSVVPQN